MTAVQGRASATTIPFGARRVAGNPAGELEAIAAALMAMGVPDVPDAWRTPSFARRVQAARTQLRSARSHSVLAACFEREACRLGPATPGSVRRADAVRAAYALRWLELATGAELPTWPGWLDCAPVGHPPDLLG